MKSSEVLLSIDAKLSQIIELLKETSTNKCCTKTECESNTIINEIIEENKIVPAILNKESMVDTVANKNKLTDLQAKANAKLEEIKKKQENERKNYIKPSRNISGKMLN